MSDAPASPSGVISLQTIAMPADTNWNGDIFGGWLMAQMDLAGAVAARKRAHGRITTVAVESMVFLHPVKIGDVISCYTFIERIGTTSMKIRIEVWETADPCQPTVKLTEGVYTYVAIDEQGRPRAVPDEACPV
jgi:acyl-CoA thioesterase YciA